MVVMKPARISIAHALARRYGFSLGLILADYLLLATPIVIVRDIFQVRLVSVHTLLAAMRLYLLIGIIFALLYDFAGTATPGGFFGSPGLRTITNALFFSFTTLTTVGYGNLVPATAIGQSLAVVEAVLGQIYLIVVVARLVSLWGSTFLDALPMPIAVGSDSDCVASDERAASSHAP
jgi:hypothetical protein